MSSAIFIMVAGCVAAARPPSAAAVCGMQHPALARPADPILLTPHCKTQLVLERAGAFFEDARSSADRAQRESATAAYSDSECRAGCWGLLPAFKSGPT